MTYPPVETIPFESLANWRLRSAEGLGLTHAEIARRTRLNPSTVYQALMNVDGRKLSATQARQIIRAFPDETPALVGYFLPEGWALHRLAGGLDTPDDLRMFFVEHGEEFGRLAAWARSAVSDGRIDDYERAQGSLLLPPLRNQLDALESALHGELVCS